MNLFEFYDAYTNKGFPFVLLGIIYLMKWFLIKPGYIKPGSILALAIIWPISILMITYVIYILDRLN